MKILVKKINGEEEEIKSVRAFAIVYLHWDGNANCQVIGSPKDSAVLAELSGKWIRGAVAENPDISGLLRPWTSFRFHWAALSLTFKLTLLLTVINLATMILALTKRL